MTGVGQHQMWASHFLPHDKPRSWLTSGGAGTMGYCIPAALGAKVGRPDATVWGIDGDGCFQMTNQELVTAALNGAPVKIAIINNNVLGMVRQWQNLFFDSRFSHTDLHSDRLPDFVKLAEAMGCAAFRVTDPDRSTTVRWSWSSSSTLTPWCGRWWPPGPATTTSRSLATWLPTGEMPGMRSHPSMTRTMRTTADDRTEEN